MTTMSRRRFLKTAAYGAAGGGVLGTAASAPGVSGTDYAIQGVDVASYQGYPDWTSVKNSGKTFVFNKATEGTTYTNPYFATNWSRIKSAGLIRGAYHYGRPGTDPVAQADYFINTVHPTSGDLQMMLDIEVTDGKSPSQVRSWIVAFINRISARTGRPGIIYTGFYFWRDSAGNGSNLNCPLFLAAYVSNPSAYVPAAWPYYTFWQYTSSGSVPGISGNVDRDAFNGSTSGLNALRLP
ncbi:MAG: glycoside hydrolase family 25 protein [Planctomycetes bacterium]|nr:glycoside hydrolase family 25 protein [Planctomycetota bacterium]